MKIGFLSPSIYMSPTVYPDMIFAPRDLSINLVDGLVKRGHEVFFFTAPDVPTKARLIPGKRELLKANVVEDKVHNKASERFRWASFYGRKRYYELDLTSRCYKAALHQRFDIIHSYHDQLAHFLDDLSPVPTVFTLHDPLPQNRKSLSYWVLKDHAFHNYVAISKSMRRFNTELKIHFVATIHHGINVDAFPFDDQPSDYLLFMGRIVPEKGLDDALKVTLALRSRLKVGAEIEDVVKNSRYFRQYIQPLLESKLITTMGVVGGVKRAKLYKGAKALLFPIHWEEPFGIVMVEAMACGTPVIAYNHGSVPEVVKDGVTGFIIDPDDGPSTGKRGRWIIKKRGVEGMIEAVKLISKIDRRACRKHIEEKFSAERMTVDYENLYRSIVEKRKKRKS